ncbi:hypothetical protein PG989_005602 [Apiospora arundinis]
MPKHLISVIALGAVGYQTELPASDHLRVERNMYQGDELRELIGKVDLYLEAGKVYHDHSSLKTPAQRRRREKKLIEYTKRVYGRYYRQGSEALVYTLGDNARPEIESLRRKIQQLASLARPQIPLIQAPCYVGCSSDATMKRSEVHHPHNLWSPRKKGYCWWLTPSCIRDMNVVPEVIAVTALRTWESGQLPLWKILATMLAQPLGEDRGYNIVQPGSTSDNPN